MTKIVWDSDALSAFLWINKINLLFDYYNDSEHIILEAVEEEIKKVKHLHDRLIAFEEVYNLEDLNVFNIEEMTYFNDLLERMGMGEAACIAYAKFHNCNYVGSNNLSDIKKECKKQSIEIKTTTIILCELVDSSNLTLDEAEELWTRMKSKRMILPLTTFKDQYDQYKNV